MERLAEKWRDKYPQIAKGLEGLVIDARRLGAPESFTSASAPVENPAVQTSEASFEIPAVNEKLYMKTREALKNEGYTFVVAIESLSIGQLALASVIRQRFGYVNTSENMRGIVPQQMEVAINPKKLRIKDSNSKSTDAQIKMIEDEETSLKGKLPQEVRDIVSMRIQNASVLAQLDGKYREERGEVLFTDWFGRTDDQTVPGHVACVGRRASADRLGVSDWHRGDGDGRVFAVSVVVLPRQLAV